MKRTNHLIDFIKGISTLGVILVHFQFPGVPGRILCAIGVSGVVFFFLVSGYFAYNEDDGMACRNLLKRFKRNLNITLIAVLVYFVYTVIHHLALRTFSEWAAKLSDPWLYVRMLILGDFEFIHADPLWFMPALLYSYLILYVLHKYKISKYAYIFLPMLLLLRIGMETYTNSCGADWHLSGNFLAGALPVMLLGHSIASRKDSITKIPLYYTVPFLLISMAMLFVTVNVRFLALDVSQIFKIWLATEAFLLALRLPERKVIPAIAVLGRKYSLDVYLYHFLIGLLITNIFVGIHAPAWVSSWILPFAVIIVSILLASAMTIMKEKRYKIESQQGGKQA